MADHCYHSTTATEQGCLECFVNVTHGEIFSSNKLIATACFPTKKSLFAHLFSQEKMLLNDFLCFYNTAFQNIHTG